MDPNTALDRIRTAVAAFNADDEFDVIEVMEAVESLDEWLCRGGFMPDPWARGYCPTVDRVVSIPTDSTCRECGYRHPKG